MFEKRSALLHNTKTRVASFVTPPTAKDNTISFTMVSDDNGGTRYSWDTGELYEERLDPAGAGFESLTTFFKDHERSVDSAIGRVKDVRVEGGTVIGDVIFGSGAAEQDVYRKYTEGILTDVSIGYRINSYKVEERENEMDLVTVTDYDIFELSAVGIGFDAGAKARTAEELPVSGEVIERVEALEKAFGIK
jgi:hypothetical protein